jgi:FkbM family methyltransferase
LRTWSDLLGRKWRGGRRLVRNLISGVRDDAPFFGYAGALRWHSTPLLNQVRYYLGARPRSKPIGVRLNGAFQVWLRPLTSDYAAYRQIFREREYANVDGAEHVEFILDCGANVGLASIYFLNRFPQARVLAVEPDPENVAMCRRNLAPYGARATILQAGVWSHRTRLTVLSPQFGAGEKWGVQVRPFRSGDPEASTVDAYDIPALLAYAGMPRVDLLKIDIERSELEVFSSAHDQWLPCVRNLVIELHGEDCAQAFFPAMEHFEYRLSHRGDLTYCLDLREKSSSVVQNGALTTG